MLYCQSCKEPSIYVMRFTPCAHMLCSDCFVKSTWRNHGDALYCLRSNPIVCWKCRVTCTHVSLMTYRADIATTKWFPHAKEGDSDSEMSSEGPPAHGDNDRDGNAAAGADNAVYAGDNAVAAAAPGKPNDGPSEGDNSRL